MAFKRVLERNGEKFGDRICAGGLDWREPKDGGVAQLGERLLCKQEAIGSIPFISTTRKGRAREDEHL